MVIQRADAEWARLNPEKLQSPQITAARRLGFKEGYMAGWIARSLDGTGRRCAGSRGEVLPGTATEVDCWVCGASVPVVSYDHPRHGPCHMLDDHNDERPEATP
jgi:hypothetical protein